MRYAFQNISRFLILAGVISIFVSINSCKKEKPTDPSPSIRFVQDSMYVSSDSILLLNKSIRFKIRATANSNIELTHFNISIRKDSLITSIDTGIFTLELNYEEEITKGMAQNETWSFYVCDRDGHKSNTISLSFYLDSASVFGDIVSLPSIMLGAQNNNTYGSFYSLSDTIVYFLTEAYNTQSIINLLYFYDLIDADKHTIASPGANIDNSVFPGSNTLSNWTKRNTTRFVEQVSITADDFIQCSNDSLILSNTFEFSTGKRKAKNLSQGDIYSFVTEEGEKGMFRVIDVKNNETGSIEIDIKMQE